RLVTGLLDCGRRAHWEPCVVLARSRLSKVSLVRKDLEEKGGGKRGGGGERGGERGMKRGGDLSCPRRRPRVAGKWHGLRPAGRWPGERCMWVSWLPVSSFSSLKV